jgi:hypothetical protein
MGISSQPQQQFIEQLRDSHMLCKPERRRYYHGEQITAVIQGLDGRHLQATRFTITHSPGSGFAGQVYCAQPEDGGSPVAIKLLRPATRWKEQFRDTLFQLSFQTTFAPRLCEEAVRAGLIWQALLRLGAEIEWGTATAVVQPLGYYWDDELRSFAEIHEWVNGRAVRYSPDEQLVRRLFDPTIALPACEMRRQRCFMASISQLCIHMGAMGLARQYEWYTFVSQANVLRRLEPVATQSEFVGVDFRPGLAVPFFLPLSPHHARIIGRGLRRGVLAHFDEVDLVQLDRYITQHADQFASVAHLITQLKEDEVIYRSGLPDLWHHPTHLGQREVRMAVTATWQKLNLISEDEAQKQLEKPLKFHLYFLFVQLPLVGHFLMRWWGNGVYRQHWQRIVSERAYRQEVTAVIRARDLVEWQEEGRVVTAVMPTLAQSLPRYWWHKLILSWLPAPLIAPRCVTGCTTGCCILCASYSSHNSAKAGCNISSPNKSKMVSFPNVKNLVSVIKSVSRRCAASCVIWG